MTAYTFDQIIDYTRTSAATYVANTGFVTQTPASRNLLTYTQEFDNAAWSKSNATALPFDPATATYGPEVISNGDFATTASWALAATAPATATIAGGKLTLVSPAGEAVSAFQAVLTVGKWYKVTGVVTVRSGTVKVICGGPTEYNFTATQSFTIYTQASTNTSFTLARQGACDADFDNISVREVIGGLITAPDGTLTGDTLVATAGTAARNCVQTAGGSGSALTLSLYAKAGTSNFVQLYHASSGTIFANFNLATGAVGTVGAGATAAITSVGSGWYRCAITFTPGSSGASRIGMITSSTAAYAESWTATGTESILIWGAQLEAASSATTYTRNVGGLYPPRFDYDPVTLAPRGLLIEEQRTNLLLRSEEFDAGNWAKSRATVTANATTSPDGTADADKLIEDTTASSTHRVFQQVSKAASSLTRTFSVYLKAGERTLARLRVADNSEVVSANIDVDLAAGTIGTASVSGGSTISAPSATILPAGNGWYRVTLTATLDATITSPGAFVFLRDGAGNISYTGDGTSGLFAWGAQWEDGAFATSYIPTVASQVTRTADVATVTGANFSRWYNQTSGTFLVEWRQGGSEAVQIAASVNDGTANNIMSVLNDNSSAAGVTPGAAVTNGGVAQANLTGAAITAGSTNKTALAYALNDFAYSQNGAAALTDTSGTIPTVDRLDIGNRVSALFTNGHIRSIKYYPARLSNAQIQALTV